MSSKSIDKFYTSDKKYYITIASWDSDVTGFSYEVGLSNLETGVFKLAKSHVQNKETAITRAEACKQLLELGWDLDRVSSLFPGLLG